MNVSLITLGLSVDYGSLNTMVAENGVSLRDVEMMETRLSGGDFLLTHSNKEKKERMDRNDRG